MYNTDMPTRAELPTTGQLLRSTAIAITTAAALLVTVVLPAEYAIDPTGIGKVLGLTEMGEIKQQLAEEAAIDSAITEATPSPQPASAPPPIAQTEVPTEAASTAESVDAWQDEVVIILKPGEAAEIKLEMNKSDLVTYEWTVSQGHLNSDLHGDGTAGQSTSYRKGRKEVSDTGDLIAEFDGTHGWFWRNRSDVDVEVTLSVRGSYGEIKRVV
ncbi:MAG: transmembrane anchor protein [Pseudomonadota bacterium]|jgi:hypothetical protein